MINKEDRYFELFKKMAFLDNQLLPDVDFVIFFKVTPSLWKKFLYKRNRKNDELFKINQLQLTQEEILDAVMKYCIKGGAKLIIYEQNESIPPEKAAIILERKLLNEIKKKGKQA